MNYCSDCGGTIVYRVPEADDRARPVCEQCGIVHYENPRVLVSLFLHHGSKLFWTRRGIAPQAGLWAFPAGFLEKNESLRQAAVRELVEETGIVINPLKLIPMNLTSVLHVDQLYVAFRCPCDEELTAQTTTETTEWGWFEEVDAPWEEMAHGGVERPLRQIYQCLQTGQFTVRVGTITNTDEHFSSFPLA